MEDASAAGGKEYAELCALAYRQSIAAHKLVEAPTVTCCGCRRKTTVTAVSIPVDLTYPLSSPLSDL